MPVVGLDESQVRQTDPIFNYPRLKFKSGERARICVVAPQFTTEFAHWLDHEPFNKSVICLGQYERLRDDGSDPENCPFCKHAKARPQERDAEQPLIALPAQSFITHVLHYRTDTSGLKVSDSLSDWSLPLWRFGAKVYRDLVGVHQIHAQVAADEGKKAPSLGEIDLIVTCENAGFQKVNIAAAPGRAQWMAKQERVDHVKSLLAEVKEDRNPEPGKGLDRLIGRHTDRVKAEERVRMILAGAGRPRQAPNTQVSKQKPGDLVGDLFDGDSLGVSDDGEIGNLVEAGQSKMNVNALLDNL